MKKKVNKNRLPELDKFDRKQKKYAGSRDKSSKQRLTIYDEFEDEDLLDYSSDIDELEE
ncbi:hypothetical protein [Draconibacterium halophilum]|uniref:DUF3073 domain-containing protein n=1 Tax=Draconibacterium halophilum TaxID=2706887 RepID=A0A6C0REC8_9BACT|nr:hypothetical protein [Draconibacterium halophilum]QIA07863.1 hypothetical protein G0Q07_09055 [Draconibacterium halophilum]